MKFIKKFTLFEKSADALSSEQIDLVELEHILIDFEQMGLDYDIKYGSSIVIDWNLFNDDKTGGSKCLNSSDIDKYTKSRTNNSLTIEFTTNDIDSGLKVKQDYNIEDTTEAYEMLRDYLFDNYDLIPNYIYINYHWNYMYFEDFDKIKEYKNIFSKDILGSEDKNIFKAHKVIFGFYK
jgi:hypothetical protein